MTDKVYLADEWADPARNKDLLKDIDQSSPIRKLIVEYVGTKNNSTEVSLEMIIQVLLNEFPELPITIAEDGFIRGYQQGLSDIEQFDKEFEEAMKATDVP